VIQQILVGANDVLKERFLSNDLFKLIRDFLIQIVPYELEKTLEEKRSFFASSFRFIKSSPLLN